MVRIILFFSIVFYSLISQSIELNDQERTYFNFLDLNNDNEISIEELNQSIKIFFQIIDSNQDGNLSEIEIIELKYIIESLL